MGSARVPISKYATLIASVRVLRYHNIRLAAMLDHFRCRSLLQASLNVCDAIAAWRTGLWRRRARLPDCSCAPAFQAFRLVPKCCFQQAKHRDIAGLEFLRDPEASTRRTPTWSAYTPIHMPRLRLDVSIAGCNSGQWGFLQRHAARTYICCVQRQSSFSSSVNLPLVFWTYRLLLTYDYRWLKLEQQHNLRPSSQWHPSRSQKGTTGISSQKMSSNMLRLTFAMFQKHQRRSRVSFVALGPPGYMAPLSGIESNLIFELGCKLTLSNEGLAPVDTRFPSQRMSPRKWSFSISLMGWELCTSFVSSMVRSTT